MNKTKSVYMLDDHDIAMIVNALRDDIRTKFHVPHGCLREVISSCIKTTIEELEREVQVLK